MQVTRDRKEGRREREEFIPYLIDITCKIQREEGLLVLRQIKERVKFIPSQIDIT